MNKIRLAILGSTRGTAMLAIIEAIKRGQLSAFIALVISDRQDALILERAKKHNLQTAWIDHAQLNQDVGKEISHKLQNHCIDLIVLIGYMRILSAEFVSQWPNKIINIHPSLLPGFSNLMDLEVHQAVLAAGHKVTGCSVHYVTEQVDQGPVLTQKKCLVYPDDTKECLKARVQALEGLALIETIESVITDAYKLRARV